MASSLFVGPVQGLKSSSPLFSMPHITYCTTYCTMQRAAHGLQCCIGVHARRSTNFCPLDAKILADPEQGFGGEINLHRSRQLLTCVGTCAQVLYIIFCGKRPQIPADMPATYRALLEDCWAADAKLRPTFKAVLSRIVSLLAAAHAGSPL